MNWIIIAPKVVIPVVASVIINKIMLIALVLSSIAKVRVYMLNLMVQYPI